MKTPVWFKPEPPGDYNPAFANYELREDGSDWPALAWKVRDLATATEIAKRINAHDALVDALENACSYLVDKVDHNDFETWAALITPINSALTAARGE